MSACIPHTARCGTRSFQRITAGFLSTPGLPFAALLAAERIEQVFARHGGFFGQSGIYETSLVVWSWLSQVLRDGKEASCQAAVARVVAHCQQERRAVPTSDTGDYCRARGKLPNGALQELSGAVAQDLECAAEQSWLWKGRHAKLIDGFTFTMPDTPSNQARYPHPKTQADGVGLPIARVLLVLSLATACILDAAMGPYSGKGTGENALLRSLLPRLSAGDVAVFDRNFSSYVMLALLRLQGVDVCVRMHQSRRVNFRRGKRLGPKDHVVTWTRPDRPDWMTPEDFARIPETLEMRELAYRIVERGRRTEMVTIATTLLDAEAYPKDEVAQLYGCRWDSEVDIRSVKSNLNVAHVRCKSPEMVQRELWMTILAYNLIRTTAASAAALHGKLPRQISFTGTCQYVLAAWMSLFDGDCSLEERLARYRTLLAHIANCEVRNRPGRLEPRVLKRRRHRYPLMNKPRNVLRKELRKVCT